MVSPEQLSLEQARDLLLPIDIEVFVKAVSATVAIHCEVLQPEGPFSPNSIGTGVHVGNGNIITASHVIKINNRSDASVTVFNSRAPFGRAAQIVLTEDDLDLAVLHTDPTDLNHILVAEAEPQQYETLFVIGTPNLGIPILSHVLYLGRLSDLYPPAHQSVYKAFTDSFALQDNIDGNQDFSSIRHGYSGGGVFNRNGALVGMLTGKSRQKPVAYAIHGSALRARLLHRLTE